MTGSFENEILIDDNGRIILGQRQPLTLEEGDKKVLRVDSWVQQPGGFCIASDGSPLTDPDKWTLKPTDYIGNKFKPGHANGMGLMVTELENGETVAYWWTKVLTLVRG